MSKPTNSESADVLLFDLGGIIIDFVGMQEVGLLMRNPPDRHTIRQMWLESTAIRQFEVGGISRNEFAEIFVEEWELAVDPQTFLAQFRSWIPGILEGIPELLAEIQPTIRLACLSNTNELHFERIRDLGVFELFERAFCSHQIRQFKPDLGAYQAVLDELEVEPNRVIFFDDNQVNVEGAATLGIPAYLVSGREQLRHRLTLLGVLRP